MEIKYSIFDPTGNITALVETEVEISAQPLIAADIMKTHPEVEQVGFVKLGSELSGTDVVLRMAGGEFCGNATMSAAALRVIRGEDDMNAVTVKVIGTEMPLAVSLVKTDTDCFDAGVEMPSARSIGGFAIDEESGTGVSGHLPLVRMEGIDHIIIEGTSDYYKLKDNTGLAEEYVRQWCGLLESECLGLMFLTRTEDDVSDEGVIHSELTPLVYVPGADTLFWENSCASGSAAAGMYLSSSLGEKVRLTLNEPAGVLKVVSEPGMGKTVLYGNTKLVSENRMECASLGPVKLTQPV